jgi:hypothetical protein
MGWVAINPRAFVTNDGEAVTYTSTTFTGSFGNAMFDNAAVGTFAANANAPYTKSDIGHADTSLCFRVVSCGIRIRYSGTALNQGGTIVALRDPTHDSLYQRTITEVQAELQARTLPVARDKWTTLLYAPYAEADFKLEHGTSHIIDLTSSLHNSWFMGFVVQAPDPSVSLPFQLEAYAVIEVQGKNVRGQQVRHTDPVGLAAGIQAATFHQASNASVADRTVAFFKKAEETIVNGVSRVEHIADATENVIGSLTGIGSGLSRGYDVASRSIGLAADFAELAI